MNLKSKNGITIIALVLTVIIMLILVGVTVKIGTNSIDESEKQDIITNMISIKTKAKIVKDKYNFKDIENLVGTPLIEDTEHTTTDVKVEIPGEKINKCYIWTQEDLNDQGLASISSNKSEFYIVCYGDDEIEVYYSKAVDGKYSLTELQEED
ncbi:MAG: hypothetical protein U0M00_05600 [Clostridia bacterium]|nr:hypothetical protein [Clostridia bacterium]